ncbi:hypothetical protein HUA74_35655 [Myxococcus sp. CA051A]|uniref:Tetratricopeptide repeat protein n=1 Tax=Myxococcus llanfairpwllgwyngyllgogerychwyrndrobwllllantysiliogogogochensis TaxID=2590453 RepID=A0A540X2Q8_9BACT|nr:MULTISPECIES: hypothetical protein [Myxococcus]NTX10671.1 hypothetical protein [Myxococcus sp. CA056]NTX41383.1 hypothetical protein [Myxococcus sp. CA033]NTX50707.1 hypothetical protein [Myxococcus sp. CA039A]NTX66006.1 hypothetical protein [Myxococcus sp. CA051A]TQF15516.1 hypothetical protein FJV41_12920 [Myxococcus llanfairpwllgwyngyllgogerychwyrndrobwllllantysiliogogogochensis]
MNVQEHLQRARELLARGQPELAESALSDAIDASVAADDLILLTQARFALGEFLFQQQRDDEALAYLQAVVRTERVDGAVDPEVKASARMLRQIRGIEPR